MNAPFPAFLTPEQAREIAVSAKTAIHRTKPSMPTSRLVGDGRIRGSVINLGKGRSVADAEAMKAAAVEYAEYDPNFAPDRTTLERKYETVVSNYVLNVLPPFVRAVAWETVREATGEDGTAYVTVRGNDKSISGVTFLDGVRTSIGTFQKAYTIDALISEARKRFKNVRILYGSKASASITAMLTGPIEPAVGEAVQEKFELTA
jgi:hypothetical protein